MTLPAARAGKHPPAVLGPGPSLLLAGTMQLSPVCVPSEGSWACRDSFGPHSNLVKSGRQGLYYSRVRGGTVFLGTPTTPGILKLLQVIKKKTTSEK